MKIRLTTYSSYRHYGGREITPHHHIVSATFVAKQSDGTTIVSLDEKCAGLPKGHKIAILQKDIIEP